MTALTRPVPSIQASADGFLGEAVHSLARDLAEAMRRLLIDTDVASAKAVEVAACLNLDKTIAWRATKVAEAHDALEALLASPAPNGLTLIRDAARQSGLTQETDTLLSDVINRFRKLIDAVPEGRVGLNSALSAAVAPAAGATDRDARRKIFQGTAHVQGFATEVGYGCNIIFPSADHPNSCDSAAINGWVRLRRLRPGAPTLLTAFGAALADDETAGKWISTFRTLAGEPAGDIDSLLLKEYSSEQLPELVVERRDRMIAVQLPGDAPQLTQSLDLFMANQARDTYRRYYEDPKQRYIMDRFASRVARKTWITDLLLHQDALPGAGDPFMTYHLAGLGPLTGIGYSPDESYDALDIGAPVQNLGRGIEALHTPEIPRIREVLRTTFDKLGHNPNDFTAWRCITEYPVPGTVAVRWIPLGPPPT